MTQASTLIDAYIDVNLLLIFVSVAWLALSRLLNLFGLSHAVTARYRLMRTLFAAVLVSPLFVALIGAAMQAGWLAGRNPVNLSDFIVAQYLQGRIEMNPSSLERMLAVRGDLPGQIAAWGGGVLVGLLGAGIALSLARLALSMLALRRVLAESYAWRRFAAVELRLSDTVSIPFSTRSLLRRIIVVPSEMLAEQDDLRIALGHELQHLRQGDVEWELSLALVQPLLFWNPAFYLWKRQHDELRELSCDRRVLSRRRVSVAAYCDCLLRVCHYGLRKRRLFSIEAPVVALVGGGARLLGVRSATLLKRRLMALVEGRRERHTVLVSILLIGPVISLTLAASVAIQKPADWSQDRIMLSTIVNLERLAVINGPVPSFGTPGW